MISGQITTLLEEKKPLLNFPELKYHIPLSLLSPQINEFKNEEKGLHQIYKDCMRASDISIKFNNELIPFDYFPDDIPALNEIQTGSVRNFELVREFLIKQLTKPGFLKTIKIHDQIEIGMYYSLLFEFLDQNGLGIQGADKTYANYTYNKKKDSLMLQTIAHGIRLHNKNDPEAEENLENKDNSTILKKLLKGTTLATELIQEDNIFKRRCVTNNHHIPIQLFTFELSKRIKTFEVKGSNKVDKREFKMLSNFFHPIRNPTTASTLKEQYYRLIDTVTNKINTKQFAFSLDQLDTSKQLDQFIRYCVDIQETVLPKVDALKIHLRKILINAVERNQDEVDNWHTTIIKPTLKILNVLEKFWSFESLASAAASHILTTTTSSFIDRINQRFENFNPSLMEIETYQNYLQKTFEVMIIPTDSPSYNL
jgi:hypothetical protein